jgi:hypothetical protein
MRLLTRDAATRHSLAMWRTRTVIQKLIPRAARCLNKHLFGFRCEMYTTVLMPCKSGGSEYSYRNARTRGHSAISDAATPQNLAHIEIKLKRIIVYLVTCMS